MKIIVRRQKKGILFTLREPLPAGTTFRVIVVECAGQCRLGIEAPYAIGITRDEFPNEPMHNPPNHHPTTQSRPGTPMIEFLNDLMSAKGLIIFGIFLIVGILLAKR